MAPVISKSALPLTKMTRARKYPRRRTVVRRSTGMTRTYALAAPSVGLGNSATTVLRTSFFANVTANVGTGIFTGFLKPGSCFDPCGDIAAIQPQMFDQFAAAYNRYKVNSCVIRMKITGTTNPGAAYAWVAAAYPAVDSTALTTYQAAASQQYAKTVSGAFQINGAAPVGTGAEGQRMSFKLNHNAIVGASSATWDIGALVTADPTTLQYMVLPLFIQATANTNAQFLLEIDMFQNVTFSQKKNTVDA